METKHTPGPWRFFMRPSHIWHIRSEATGNIRARSVAFTMGRYSPEGITQNEANARLISAAPDLLAACQYIVSAGEDGDEMAAIERATAAIAKALGEERT